MFECRTSLDSDTQRQKSVHHAFDELNENQSHDLLLHEAYETRNLVRCETLAAQGWIKFLYERPFCPFALVHESNSGCSCLTIVSKRAKKRSLANVHH